MFNPHIFACRNGVRLAVASAISLGLAGCGKQATPEVKLEAVKVTPEKEFVANLRKAEAGDAEAQKNVGVAYHNGEGVSKDVSKAVEWARRSAEQGNAVAQTILGLSYMDGDGNPKNATKAVEWWQKAASQGYARAQGMLGWAYDNGNGVSKDEAKAREWWEKAATQGNAMSQASLGDMYFKGRGIPIDFVKARELLEKAAAQGNSYGQFGLARMYSGGKGVPKDSAKAVDWWQKAAMQGHATAQEYLAWALSAGEGVSKDIVLAYAWANLSASEGDLDTVKRRDLYESGLSPSEKAEAQRLSSNWKKGQVLVRENQPASSTAKTSITSGNLTKMGTGTAFIVGRSGEAITNHHVVDGCKEVRIDGRDGVAKVTTSDSFNDVALIQVPGAINATAVVSANPTKLRQGHDIIVFGFPLNAVLSSGGNLTPGVVSALTGLGNNTNQIQITAPVQPGSSGSPVLNKRGEIVGVVSMKLSDANMAKATGQIGQNVNFAVSGQTLTSFLDAHQVEYRKGGLISFDKSTADLADEARKWTTVVECWK